MSPKNRRKFYSYEIKKKTHDPKPLFVVVSDGAHQSQCHSSFSLQFHYQVAESLNEFIYLFYFMEAEWWEVLFEASVHQRSLIHQKKKGKRSLKEASGLDCSSWNAAWSVGMFLIRLVFVRWDCPGPSGEPGHILQHLFKLDPPSLIEALCPAHGSAAGLEGEGMEGALTIAHSTF